MKDFKREVKQEVRRPHNTVCFNENLEPGSVVEMVLLVNGAEKDRARYTVDASLEAGVTKERLTAFFTIIPGGDGV